jgi:hypothetical protein
MKYIMFETYTPQGHVVHTPIMFPNYLVHAEVAKEMMAHPQLKGANIHSAGFVRFHGVECSGDSGTLNLKSDVPRDDITIANYDIHQGIQPNK